ncbi:MAG TPA: site-specific integrase [Desulfatiglandales bacterium]|nr:site-specific integrase [Desulfatiglandales bacterium]
MQISEAAKLWLEYHKSHSKENSIRAYRLVLTQLCKEFGSENLEDITTERILFFLNRITEGKKRQTKRTRYSHLLAFFNFIKNNLDQEVRNPCDTPMLKKLFRARPSYHWNIIEKETVDEVIFRTSKPRNRLMLELMARGGMRISEVLKLTPSDIHDRRLTLRDPKSGREQEFIFIPQRLADRLKDYIRQKGIQPQQRIFPICYEAARDMVAKVGSVVGIHLRPHDLRRHAATYASRSGVPIEIVSKVILRHSNLSTTERYLGKISDVEAMKWIDNLYA